MGGEWHFKTAIWSFFHFVFGSILKQHSVDIPDFFIAVHFGFLLNSVRDTMLRSTPLVWSESDLGIDSFNQLAEGLATCSVFLLITWMLPLQQSSRNWVWAGCISRLHNWGKFFVYSNWLLEVRRLSGFPPGFHT